LEQPQKELVIHHIQPEENSNIQLLGYKEELTWTFDKNKGLIIQIPKDIPGEIAWTFKIKGKEI
jgi:hypothetical protein